MKNPVVELVKDIINPNFFGTPSPDLAKQAARMLGILDPGDIGNITINGRQVANLKCAPDYVYSVKTIFSGTQLQIRVDDRNHLDFWLEINIPIKAIMQIITQNNMELSNERPTFT